MDMCSNDNRQSETLALCNERWPCAEHARFAVSAYSALDEYLNKEGDVEDGERV